MTTRSVPGARPALFRERRASGSIDSSGERRRLRAVEPGLSGASCAARGGLLAGRCERYDGEEATATHALRATMA